MRWLCLALLVGCPQKDDPGETDEVDRVAEVLVFTGDATNGADVWDEHCLGCHTLDVAAIFGDRPEENQIRAVLTGPGGMPPFDGVITDQEIADVVAFMSSQ